jgi:ribulose-5-phosphate 4-epimerase/fuculose-1-phosphate aldolase
VLHTHTRAGVAVSCMAEGLLPLNQFSLNFYNRIAYHDYEGIALDSDECTRLQQDLGKHKAMILRNHGLLTVGRTIPEAFELMYYLDQSCRVQVDVMSSGAKIAPVLPDVGEHTAKQFESFEGRGERGWPSLLRMLDAKDPSYRD